MEDDACSSLTRQLELLTAARRSRLTWIPMARMEPASLKTAHSREKVMMTFSTQNGEIFQSATFPDRVSIEDKGGKCYTSETGGASGGSTSFFDVAGKYQRGHPRRFLLYTQPFSSKTPKTDSGTTLYSAFLTLMGRTPHIQYCSSSPA